MPLDQTQIANLTISYEPFLVGILLGTIKCTNQNGFFRRWNNQGRTTTTAYGKSLLKGLKSLSQEERNNLNRLNNEKLDDWQANGNSENLEKLNALFVYWLNNVFTDQDDLFYVVVRRIQLQKLNILITLLNETNEQVFTRIGTRLGNFADDPIVTNDFSKVNDFSTELEYQDEKMSAKLRALKF